MPDADGAGTVLFADLQAVLAMVDADDADLAALEAVGAAGSADGFRLRLTVR